ncbi:unnamed protein product [Closterium sp. NIES-53]
MGKTSHMCKSGKASGMSHMVLTITNNTSNANNASIAGNMSNMGDECEAVVPSREWGKEGRRGPLLVVIALEAPERVEGPQDAAYWAQVEEDARRCSAVDEGEGTGDVGRERGEEGEGGEGEEGGESGEEKEGGPPVGAGGRGGDGEDEGGMVDAKAVAGARKGRVAAEAGGAGEGAEGGEAAEPVRTPSAAAAAAAGARDEAGRRGVAGVAARVAGGERVRVRAEALQRVVRTFGIEEMWRAVPVEVILRAHGADGEDGVDGADEMGGMGGADAVDEMGMMGVVDGGDGLDEVGKAEQLLLEGSHGEERELSTVQSGGGAVWRIHPLPHHVHCSTLR